jgi:hypothetical protein
LEFVSGVVHFYQKCEGLKHYRRQHIPRECLNNRCLEEGKMKEQRKSKREERKSKREERKEEK